MFPKIFSKSYSLKILLFLSFFLFSYGQAPQCILGKNCPYNQGVCATPNFCKCNEGFETLIDETALPGQQIYCNYEQMSQYMPIILEAFLPSMGHFVAGNIWLGIGKLILVISFVLSSFSLYDEIRVPTLMKYLFEKFNIAKFLGLEEEEKEKGEQEKEKEDDNKEENQLLRGKNSKDRKGISKEEDVEKENDIVKENDDDENDGYKIGYQAYDEEEEETPDQEEELISKEDKKKQKEKAKKKKDKKNEKEHKFIKLIFDLTGSFGSLVYFMDIFLYKFKIYTDGNGIAFV